mgnify:CR=1 FL=1|tara:strand:- start:3219 stop:3377 length:159 start_codon:yes stop_codon:yes gene_type:complete
MKVTLLKACKLQGNNWKKGDTPSVHPFFASELMEKGFIEDPDADTENELTEE